MTKSEVIEALANLESRASVLALKVSDKNLVKEEAGPIQESVSSLKEHIRGEYKRLEKHRNIDPGDYEQTFYWPAIQDAWANYRLSQLRTNGRPKAEWAKYLNDIAFAARYWTPKD